MTSFAFILGVVPLVVGEGAGAEMRRSLGTAVFCGMIGVTFFGIFLTPVFYYALMYFGGKQPAVPKLASTSGDGHAPRTALTDKQAHEHGIQAEGPKH